MQTLRTVLTQQYHYNEITVFALLMSVVQRKDAKEYADISSGFEAVIHH